MNRLIARLFALVCVLFGLLVASTSLASLDRAIRWRDFSVVRLNEHPANRRKLLEQQRIPRGLILARDGTRLAVSHSLGRGAERRYVRSYPTGPLFGHVVGYSFVSRGDAGLEKSENDALTGSGGEFTSLLDELQGAGREGEDVHTTLDPKAQRAAIGGLAGRRGSVVALEPATGRVRVMASVPSYDPNSVPRNYARLNSDPQSPLFNRATQARYPPGSTFKVVTATAALDNGHYTPDSTVDGSDGKVISGTPLHNFGGQDYGPLTLTDALTHSVNTVWAEVGEKLGKDAMFEYMHRFGFGEEPKLDYPRNQLTPSGVFTKKQGLLDARDGVDIGRVAIGQERLQVTPLQMAEVAATVANRGTLMRPRLVERVVGKDGRVKRRVQPRPQEEVMKPATATALAEMMSKVVEEGSGTAGALQGIRVAGKTGTAEIVPGVQNQAWFIAFAPVESPRVAVAVTIERAGLATGGEAAAPIAKRVMQELLGGG